MKQQPWICSWRADSLLILLPPFAAVFFVWFFRSSLDQTTGMPLWAWVAFVLCIDVAHVYGTLFRTYLDPVEFRSRQTLLTLVPLGCWIAGVLLYSVHPMLFWSLLAYLAVFHFARQQYGFLMLYSRNEAREYVWIDKGVVYLATLYPIVYWHIHLPRNFHWFVDGDFLVGIPHWISPVAAAAYGLFALAYAFKEVRRALLDRAINIPKQMIVLGTALSWYVGIIALNGDMAFTITNVVSHGLPYLGLVWIFGRKQSTRQPERRFWGNVSPARLFSLPLLPLFAGGLIALAFVEEGLWDGFVWRDHSSFFTAFAGLPHVYDRGTLAWLVPLLSLPQTTHYVLDGFIWKLRDKNSHWQEVAFEGRTL